MGSSKSKSTTTYDSGPWQPTVGPLTQNAMPRLEQGYQAMTQSPLIGQAQGYTSDVLAGKYLTPESNPYLMNYANAAMRNFQSGQNTLMARAGRGNLSGGDMQQAMGRGMTEAMVAPLLQQYNLERGFQDTASRAAPSQAIASGAPAEWYAGQMANLARLGKSGKDTTETQTTPSLGQTITGTALSALGMMSGNPMAGMGMMGPGAASMMNPMAAGGMFSSQYGPPAPLPWMVGQGGGYR